MTTQQKHVFAVFASALLVATDVLASGTALFSDSVLFHASMDGSYVADVAKGGGTPLEQAGTNFVTGKFGQAALIGPDAGYVAYPQAGNLNPREGTATCWVRFTDWVPVRQGPDHFRLLRCGDGFFWGLNPFWYDYALGVGDRDFVFTRSAEIINAFRLNWMKQTDWIFLACTWQSGVARLYVNSNLSGETLDGNIGTIARLTDRMWLGQNEPYTYVMNGASAGTGHLAMDELTIYDRAMQPMEVRMLYEQAGVTAPVGGLLVSTKEYIITGKLEFWLSARALTNATEATTATAVFRRGNRVSQTTSLGPIVAGALHAVVDTARLKPGKYSLDVQLLDAKGNVVTSKTQAYAKQPLPEWVGNTLGKEPTVPAPFTSVETTGDLIRCWGRTYDFADNLLPARIVTLETNSVLASPMTVRLGVKEADKVAWHSVPCTKKDVPEKAANRAVFRRQGESDGVRVTALSECEFDGTVWLTVTAEPVAGPVELQGIRVDVPIDTATIRGIDTGMEAHFGVVDPDALFLACGDVTNLPPLRTMGVYNTQAGMLLGTVRWIRRGPNEAQDEARRKEAPLDWVAGPQSAEWAKWRPTTLRAVRDGKTLTACEIELNVVEGPYTLKAPLTFTFYIQGLPVKPLPSDLYFYRAGGSRSSLGSREPLATDTKIRRLRLLDKLEFSDYFFSQYDYCDRDEVCPPSVENEAEMERCRQRLAPAVKQGIPALAYMSTCVVRKPEYLPDWSANSGAEVVTLDSSYADFAIWNMNEYIRKLRAEKLPIDGIYFDNTLYIFGADDVTGLGWVDAQGKRWPSFDMRRYWDFRKRMFISLSQLVGPRLRMADNIPEIRAPFLSFSTRFVLGEGHIFMQPPAHDFDRNLLLSYRTKYSPLVLSAGCTWFSTPIAYLDQPKDRRYMLGAEYGPTDFVVGLAYLHGISADGYSGQHYPHTFRLYEALDYFDLRGDTVKFTGYWENGDRVKTDNPEVPVSLYTRLGRAMLFAVNLSKEPQTVHVKLDFARLGLRSFAGIRISDPFYAERFFVENDSFTFTIPGRAYRPMIVCDDVIGDTDVVAP